MNKVQIRFCCIHITGVVVYYIRYGRMHALLWFAWKYLCEYKRSGQNAGTHWRDVLLHHICSQSYKIEIRVTNSVWFFYNLFCSIQSWSFHLQCIWHRQPFSEDSCHSNHHITKDKWPFLYYLVYTGRGLTASKSVKW